MASPGIFIRSFRLFSRRWHKLIFLGFFADFIPSLLAAFHIGNPLTLIWVPYILTCWLLMVWSNAAGNFINQSDSGVTTILNSLSKTKRNLPTFGGLILLNFIICGAGGTFLFKILAKMIGIQATFLRLGFLLTSIACFSLCFFSVGLFSILKPNAIRGIALIPIVRYVIKEKYEFLMSVGSIWLTLYLICIVGSNYLLELNYGMCTSFIESVNMPKDYWLFKLLILFTGTFLFSYASSFEVAASDMATSSKESKHRMNKKIRFGSVLTVAVFTALVVFSSNEYLSLRLIRVSGANKDFSALSKLNPKSNFFIRTQLVSHPLVDAARSNNVELIEWYLKYGTPINTKNLDGVTPLIAAAKTHQEEAVKYLLNHGADPLLKDRRGESAMLIFR